MRRPPGRTGRREEKRKRGTRKREKKEILDR